MDITNQAHPKPRHVWRTITAASLLVLASCGAEADNTKWRGSAAAPTGAAGSAAGGLPGVTTTSNIPPPTQTFVPTPGSTTGLGAGCVPGHYVGTFTGTYNSAAWGNGSVPLTVEAVPSMGRPGLEFWLEQSAGECAPGAEFCADFTVKGGKIRGFANPFSDDDEPDDDDRGGGFALAIRFEIDFGGELDCSSGQFKGLLQNGCYDVATILFRFEGTAPATYDQTSKSFTAGQWSVKEMEMPNVIFPPDAMIGGMGAWEASLATDNAVPADVTMGLCHM